MENDLIQNHSALYTPLDIQYNNVMSGPYQVFYPIGYDALVAGIKDGKVTGFWRPMVCVGSDNYQNAVIEMIWRKISHDIFYEDFLVDGKLSPISRFLLNKGYKATPYYTQVIDLTKTVDELHADLRKSYKSLCNSTDWEEGVLCVRSIHWKMHGKKTRPDETWEIQAKMGFSLINTGHTAGVTFYVGPVWAYYACSASIENANTHHLIWQSILECKRRGCKYLEMGEQYYGEDEKLRGISHFKNGFGGKTVVRLRLAKVD